jgi:hypothetical protein
VVRWAFGVPRCRLVTVNCTTRSIMAVNVVADRLRQIYRDQAITFMP